MTDEFQRSELEALARDAGGGDWCLHPNGTSVWTGDEYDTEGNKPQQMILTGTPSEGDAALLAFVAAANPAAVLELLEFYGLSDVVSGGSLEDPDEICAVCGSATDTGHTHEECFTEGQHIGVDAHDATCAEALAGALGIEYQGQSCTDVLALVEQLRADSLLLARGLDLATQDSDRFIMGLDLREAFERVLKP